MSKHEGVIESVTLGGRTFNVSDDDGDPVRTMARAYNPVVEIVKEVCCGKCDWPLVAVKCVDEMESFRWEDNSEYWIYCVNKNCTQHEGQGVKQKEVPECGSIG